MINWMVFAIAVGASLLATLAVLPYLRQSGLLNAVEARGDVNVRVLLAAQVAQAALLSALAAFLGLWLGGRVGLGAPVLDAWLSGGAVPGIGATLARAAGIGVAAGLVLVVLEAVVFVPWTGQDLFAEERTAPVWMRLAASLYGGITEEVLLRLGLLTVLLWLGTRVLPGEEITAGLFWAANLLAGVVFAAGHLPATAQKVALTPGVVARGLTLNLIAALAFGWLYWQWGLVPAVVAHFSADIVVHVIYPALPAPHAVRMQTA